MTKEEFEAEVLTIAQDTDVLKEFAKIISDADEFYVHSPELSDALKDMVRAGQDVVLVALSLAARINKNRQD